MARKEPQGLKETTDQLDHLVHREMLVLQEYKDHRGIQDHLDHKGMQDLLEILVLLVLRVHLVREEKREWWVNQGLKVKKECLDHPVLLVLEEQRVNQVDLVQKGRLDHKDHPDHRGQMATQDLKAQ